MTLFRIEYRQHGRVDSVEYVGSKTEQRTKCDAWMRAAPYSRSTRILTAENPRTKKELLAMLNDWAVAPNGAAE